MCCPGYYLPYLSGCCGGPVRSYYPTTRRTPWSTQIYCLNHYARTCCSLRIVTRCRFMNWPIRRIATTLPAFSTISVLKVAGWKYGVPKLSNDATTKASSHNKIVPAIIKHIFVCSNKTVSATTTTTFATRKSCLLKQNHHLHHLQQQNYLQA